MIGHKLRSLILCTYFQSLQLIKRQSQTLSHPPHSRCKRRGLILLANQLSVKEEAPPTSSQIANHLPKSSAVVNHTQSHVAMTTPVTITKASTASYMHPQTAVSQASVACNSQSERNHFGATPVSSAQQSHDTLDHDLGSDLGDSFSPGECHIS